MPEYEVNIQISFLHHKLYVEKFSTKKGGGQNCLRNCPRGLWMTLFYPFVCPTMGNSNNGDGKNFCQGSYIADVLVSTTETAKATATATLT